MPPEEEKFDVRVLSTPHATPQGEEFAPALARIFGVELWMAEHVAQHAPLFVKRGVTLAVAEHLQATLERLGAGVVIQSESLRLSGAPRSPMDSAGASLPPASARPGRASAWPPGLPPDSPHAPRDLPDGRGPRPARLPSEWANERTYERASDRAQPSPPPRKSVAFRSLSPLPDSLAPDAPSRRPSSSGALRPTAPPTVRAWTPLPTPPPRRPVGTGTILLGAAAAIAVLLVGATHWLRQLGDAQTLGNIPAEQTSCATHFGLTGPGLDEATRAKLTLVVAWRTGCLSDDYRAFLQGLADAHRGELAIVGAALAVTPAAGSSGLGKLPLPPPDPWPPRDCEPGFELLPASRGYVSDALAAPATYLYDADGNLIAAWRGGMSPQQRERLTSWLEKRSAW